MPLVLDQDQLQIQDSARRYFSQSAPTAAFRALRNQHSALGYSPEIWQQLVDMGFAATAIPESCGGLGLGLVTLGSILEEAGRTLCASPLFATSVLGASAIELAGSAQQHREILGAISSGKLTLAFAHEEGPRHDPQTVRATATRRGNAYVLNGQKQFVIDGASADQLIVVARHQDAHGTNDALGFFLVDHAAPGLVVTPLRMADSRNIAQLTLTDVVVDAGARLEAGSESVLDAVLDRARACLAAEMLGGIAELFDRTIAYLREREQFGVRIGSFQGLKHRAARMYTEIELTRSAVIAALSALDANAADSALLASLAKARANDCYRLVSNEAIQMHGGIGVTDELDIGLFLKRSRISMQCFGDSAYLRNRYATLSGY